MDRLKSLHISNFRGASSLLPLEFDDSKPIAVIFGENGTGKSTIADALDALGNGTAGSLGDRSSVNPKEHLPTLGKTSKDMRIILETKGHTWTSAVGRDGIPVSSSSRPVIRVLRRAPLLAMVNATPSERYKALQGFIDIQGVEKSEEALNKALADAKRDRDAKVGLRVHAEAQLREAWEREGRPAPDPLGWSAESAASDGSALEASARTLRETAAAIRNAEQRLSDYDAALQVREEKRKEAARVEGEIARLPSANNQDVLALVGLLGQTSTFLASWGREDRCPVCEQGIPLDRLKADLKRRIDQFGAFETVRREQEAATQASQAHEHALTVQGGNLLRAARPLVALLSRPDLGPVAAKELNPGQYPELAQADGGLSALAVEQARNLIRVLAPLCAPLENGAREATAKAEKRGLVSALRDTYLENVRDSESLERTCAALEVALELAKRTRIDYTQGILDDVRDECNRLYLAIHPEEKLALSRLELDPERRASLLQKANFETKTDVPPQAYFSESHLDTLAFCFWLALAKREFPESEAVLVLDDVFTSVDAQHLERIADLIVDESKHFAHVLLLTHQRRWWEHFRSPYGAGQWAQMIHLDRWRLDRGVQAYTAKPEVMDLLELLRMAPLDRRQAASKAGILLERVLEGLGRRYRCAAPWSAHGGPTLAELMDGTSSVFKALEIHRPQRDASGGMVQPIQFVHTKPKEAFDRIRSHSFVRNWVGAHHNPHGSDLPDAEVEAFVDMTLRFAEALSCPECGQIPSRSAGTHYACSCPPEWAVRMIPLKL